MPPRSLSSGIISFGLVNIPVKVYSASESGSRIGFNQLHSKCKGRLKQQLYCPVDDEVVPREDIVKGYEFAKDQYVLFSDEELKALDEAASPAIEVSEFVPLSSVDPLYFDTGYYLGPDRGADRAFKLLSQALTQSGRAALGKQISRGRQHVVLIRPANGALILQQLRSADEVRSLSELPAVEAEVKPAELALALQLIQQGSSEVFEPAKYKDEHKERLLQMIEQKVKGEQVAVSAPPVAAPAPVVDLMEALKASLAREGQTSETTQAEPKEAPRKDPQRAARGGSGAGATKKAQRR